MGSLVINKNHVAVSASNTITQICNDMFKRFGVAYFNYSRFYNNATHTSLTSDGDWAEYFYTVDYKNKFLYDQSLFEMASDFKYFLWASFPENKLIQNLRENYGYDHGIVIVESSDEHNDYYSFAGKRDNPAIMNFFINNIDLLNQFIHFFKESGKGIIDKANQDLISLPGNEPAQQEDSSDIVAMPYDYTKHVTQRYAKELVINRYYFIQNGMESYLTRAEYLCAKYYALGYSAKEIAAMNDRSAKTVESQVNQVKLKLGAHSRSTIREKFYKFFPGEMT